MVRDDKIFVDTSAFYALIDRSDNKHYNARKTWNALIDKNLRLFTTNYIVVESLALLQSRLGFDAAHLWNRDILNIVDFLWIDEPLHHRALELWFSLGKRRLSLVDCCSFAVMRKYDIEKVFGFNAHFVEQGFVPVEDSL